MMLAVALVLAVPVPAQASHRGDRYADNGGDRYGGGNGPDDGNDGDQSRCHGQGCRGSFSPGPFDRSPVEITGNTVCMPGATCYANPPKENPK
jgi:hypothetical protein